MLVVWTATSVIYRARLSEKLVRKKLNRTANAVVRQAAVPPGAVAPARAGGFWSGRLGNGGEAPLRLRWTHLVSEGSVFLVITAWDLEKRTLRCGGTEHSFFFVPSHDRLSRLRWRDQLGYYTRLLADSNHLQAFASLCKEDATQQARHHTMTRYK